MITFFGFFDEINDFNIESCEKISGKKGAKDTKRKTGLIFVGSIGPQDFVNCEDFVLSDEPGIAYATCDPILTYYNKVMGINRLAPGQPIENGAVWRVRYDEVRKNYRFLFKNNMHHLFLQTPVDLEKLEIGPLKDYHPLGINLDIHPTTGKKTILSVNMAHNHTPSIELFILQDKHLVHKHTIRHPGIYNPNSVYALRDERFRAEDGTPSFFFSNDHYFHIPLLKAIEPYFFPLSNVNFYDARTGQIHKVVDNILFANGVAGTDDVLFVSEIGKSTVRQYKINRQPDGFPSVYLDFVNEVKVGGAPDNLYYNAKEDILMIALHPKPLDIYKRLLSDPAEAHPSPSKVMVWNIGTGETKVILQDDGSLFSTSTSAAFDTKHSKLIVSGVQEEGLLICDF